MKIASPCQAPWDQMTGDDRARFCGRCKLNVYNLSGMTEAQARTLIEEREGNVCVRFYQRPDGTVLTRDCPVRFRTLRRRLAIAAGALLAAAGAVFFAGRDAGSSFSWRHVKPFSTLLQWLNPPTEQPLMGKPCVPPGR